MHHTSNVAIADQPNGGTSCPHFFNQSRVAWTIHDASRDFVWLHTLCLGNSMDVVSRRRIKIDDAPRIARTNGNLFHVNIWCVKQVAFLSDGNNGQRVRQILCANRRAFQRIERDINVRPLLGADFFTNIKHWRFIAFAFTDHDCTGNW